MYIVVVKALVKSFVYVFYFYFYYVFSLLLCFSKAKSFFLIYFLYAKSNTLLKLEHVDMQTLCPF